jgi:hypothetical protein
MWYIERQIAADTVIMRVYGPLPCSQNAASSIVLRQRCCIANFKITTWSDPQARPSENPLALNFCIRTFEQAGKKAWKRPKNSACTDSNIAGVYIVKKKGITKSKKQLKFHWSSFFAGPMVYGMGLGA